MAAGNPRPSAKRASRRKELRRYLPRKKEGPDETGKDVESQRGSFSRAGTVEVDDAETMLDNKEKEEGHELVIAGGAEKGCGVRERKISLKEERELWGWR